MKIPDKPSLAALFGAGLFCSTALVFRVAFPPQRMVGDSQLLGLRAEQTQLAPYTDSAASVADARLAAVRRQLWTPQSFFAWRGAHVPAGWIVQELDSGEPKHVRTRRYAFQKPGATDADWPSMLAFLGSLESSPCLSVQSVALAVQPGYEGSRRFAQCLIVAVFYFAADGPSPSPPA